MDSRRPHRSSVQSDCLMTGGLPRANPIRMRVCFERCIGKMKTQLWTILVKVTPEEYVHDGQAVSEGYETPSQPLYHHNHHNSIRVNVEANQPDAGPISSGPNWRLRANRAWRSTNGDKGWSDW